MKHFAKAGLGGTVAAGILGNLRKRASTGTPGRKSLKHFEKAGFSGAVGAGILETLCKSVPLWGRRGGNP